MRILLPVCVAVALPAWVVAAESPDFNTHVKPILVKHCLVCHGTEKQRGGLRLDTATAVLKGGDSGPAVVAGKGGDSRLVKAVTGHKDVEVMPPRGDRLSKEEVAVIGGWIDAGAKLPPDERVVKPDPRAKHWAFQPIKKHEPPDVKKTGWVRNPIDRFVLARLEKDKIEPSPEADRVTLLRRLSLDLIGLPPTPKEIDDFLADKRSDAYERQVERLLASPHYGERWGRHWLDQARYADSNGYSIDGPRTIWPFRDWVINALNADKPFDQFATEQLAGDLLPDATKEQKIATGFHRNTMINQEGGIDVEQFRVEAVIDRVNTTSTVFLGLTVGCAQCHDHKFDPIATKEYYQLFAFFNNCDEPTLELALPEVVKERDRVKKQVAALEKRLKSIDPGTAERLAMWEGSLSAEARAALPKNIQTILAIAPNGRTAKQEQALTAAFRKFDQVRHAVGGFADPLPFAAAAHLHAASQRLVLEKEINALKNRMPAIPATMVVQERKTPRPTHIHKGGDFTKKGAPVSPGTLAILHPLPAGDKLNRLDLARWVFDPKNPLTARVAVNRIWQAYFGTGLVETDNDFGTQGTPPSHPELLDWLAATFRDGGWKVKDLHRLVVTSATYRQSSKARPDLKDLDARNRLLARQNRLRLEAEVVRDVSLAASGLLNPKVGGPSVFPPQPAGVYAFTQVPKDWKPSTGEDRYRRGLYVYFWRSAPHPGLTVFDAPDAITACTRRTRSNTPLQALTLLNDQAHLEFAQGLAARILKEDGSDEARLTTAFRLCVGRPPSSREKAILGGLLSRQIESLKKAPEEAKALLPAEMPKGTDSVQGAAWTMVARALLNLDEFITRE